MGILDRIRKIFSRSNSSSTDNFPQRHEIVRETNIQAVHASTQVERNVNPSISTTESQPHTVGTGKSSSFDFYRSNVSTTQASTSSHTQPETFFQTENSCKGFDYMIPYSPKRTNISQFPRSTGPHAYGETYLSSKTNNSQKASHPTLIKLISAGKECATRTSGRKGSQKTPKFLDQCDIKQKGNHNDLSNMEDVDNVNTSEFVINIFGPTTRTRLERSPSSISAAFESEGYRSQDETRSLKSKNVMPKTAKENNTSINPRPVTISPFSSVSLQNQTNTTVSDKDIKACNICPISQGDDILDNCNTTTRTPSTCKASSSLVSNVTSPKLESPKLSDHSRKVIDMPSNAHQRKIFDNSKTTQVFHNNNPQHYTTSITKTSSFVAALPTPHKINSSTDPDNPSGRIKEQVKYSQEPCTKISAEENIRSLQQVVAGIKRRSSPDSLRQSVAGYHSKFECYSKTKKSVKMTPSSLNVKSSAIQSATTLQTNVSSTVVGQTTKLQYPFSISHFTDTCPEGNVSSLTSSPNFDKSTVAGHVREVKYPFTISHFKQTADTFGKTTSPANFITHNKLDSSPHSTNNYLTSTKPLHEFSNLQNHVTNLVPEVRDPRPLPTLSSFQSSSSQSVFTVPRSSPKPNYPTLKTPGEVTKTLPTKFLSTPSFVLFPNVKVSKNVEVTRHQYYLQNFTSKLKTSPEDKSFKPQNDVVYHNQWTECSAMILDKFKQKIGSHKAIEINSNSHVEFRDSRIKKGRLHFSMKSSETGNISINIQIDDVTLTKEVYVTNNPCSSSLSGMTINLEKDEFVFRVFIFDVFGQPVYSDPAENCEIDASSPSTNPVISEGKHTVDGQLYYDVTVSGDRPWSRDLLVLLNGEQVGHPEEFDLTEEECAALRKLNDEDYDWALEVLEEDDDGIYIPILTGEDDGKYVEYDENNCELQSLSGNDVRLICKNVRKFDILPDRPVVDFAHIDNIKRVLNLKDRVEIKENADQTHVIIELRNVKSPLLPVCKEVVQHLLRGLHCRKKASQAARVRMEWKNTLIGLDEALSENSPSYRLCKHFRDFFGRLLNRYNCEACDELFKFFNFQRDESEVDLHGLLVADEKRLELLRLYMLIRSLDERQIKGILTIAKIKSRAGGERQTLRRKLRKGEVPKAVVKDFKNLKTLKSDTRWEEVDTLIKSFRFEGDEAIRKLNGKLDNFDLDEAIESNTPWLEIIVGAGHHSKIKNQQNIRPKVEKLLKERKLDFTAVNKGALVVTFEEYSGPEPCFGEYYCDKCEYCWKSSNSYVRNYQECSHCQKKCLPVKQREKVKVDKHNRDGGPSVKRKAKPHQSRLCQRCRELGHPCNEEDY